MKGVLKTLFINPGLLMFIDLALSLTFNSHLNPSKNGKHTKITRRNHSA